MANKRAQAALEFLSTYGFAFLIILVMIGALSYFGILKPQNFLPGRCLISSEFSCTDRIINRDIPAAGNAELNITIKNNLGNTVVFQSGNATSDFGYGGCYYATASIVGGQTVQVTCSLNTSLTGVANGAAFPAKGQKTKIAYTIIYRELGGAYDRSIQGEVADTIQ